MTDCWFRWHLSKTLHYSNFSFFLGYDVIAQAQSGTGKTATFAISILQQIDVELKGTQALVLAPTRELAQQVSSKTLEQFDVRPVSFCFEYKGRDFCSFVGRFDEIRDDVCHPNNQCLKCAEQVQAYCANWFAFI